MKKRVLIVGSNPTLLDSRRDVLETNGISAEARLLETIPPDLLASTEVELVVACSSLTPDARRAIVASAHRANPKPLCLVVEPDLNPATATPDADANILALYGPAKFVHVVQTMLSI